MNREFQSYIEAQGSQQAVADQFGVTQATVSRWASGKLKIEPSKVLRVSEMTGIPPHKLRPDVYPEATP